MSLESRLIELVETLGHDYAAVLLQTQDERDQMNNAARTADFFTPYYDGKAQVPNP